MASKVVNQARRLLRSAGVDPEMIDTVLAFGDSAAQRIVDQPATASALAQQHPAQNLSQYQEARASYGFEDRLTADTFSGAGGPDAMARNLLTRKGYQTNKSGALFFDNGVIADPTTGDVFMPPNKADVPGSFAWLENVQESWGEDKINEWRKRLSDYGYDVAKKGPLDQTFLAALQGYHQSRYLNGGKPLPVDAAAAGKTGEERVFDPVEIRNAVRQQFRTAFGDDPSDAELEEWSGFIKSTARRLVNKKGYDPADAAVATEERFIEKFETDPKVKFLQDAEEDNTELRDGLLGVIQTINSVSR